MAKLQDLPPGRMASGLNLLPKLSLLSASSIMVRMRPPSPDGQLAAERELGRDPVEMPHNNLGYEIRSDILDDQGNRTGESMFIEIKGKGFSQSTAGLSLGDR